METESRGSACPPIAETLVARLWDDQRPFNLPLRTVDGEEIQVVYRGRRRWDRGPDFSGALIAWGGIHLRRGDVEIHLRSSDWRNHGHHRDAHYNRVILQVVMWHDAAEPSRREDGVPVPVLALAPVLAAPLGSLPSDLASDGPLPRPCWRGSAEDADLLGGLLDRCGMERFDARVALFEADLTCRSPDHLLYRGTAVALGYSQNREPFGRLADLAPLEALAAFRGGGAGSSAEGDVSDRSGLEALLLGAAGLLPRQRGLPRAEVDSYARRLEARWESDGAVWVGGPMRASEWEFFRVRPANFPTRRIAALAALVDRWPGGGLAHLLVDLVRSSDARGLPRMLEAFLLGDRPEGYWSYHSDFGLPVARPVHLVGRQRAAEIVVNVFLPVLAAWSSHLRDDELASRVREVYRVYPRRGDNEITRHVATEILGVSRPPVARSACRQQGLLHLYWTHCEVKSCGECPVRSAGRRERGAGTV